LLLAFTLLAFFSTAVCVCAAVAFVFLPPPPPLPPPLTVCVPALELLTLHTLPAELTLLGVVPKDAAEGVNSDGVDGVAGAETTGGGATGVKKPMSVSVPLSPYLLEPRSASWPMPNMDGAGDSGSRPDPNSKLAA
jgi:hypothetical protein